MIQKIYDNFFRSVSAGEEWSVWHERTKARIARAKAEGKAFELSDPTEVKYYKWIADEIFGFVGSIEGPILEVGGGSGALSLELSRRSGYKATIFDSSDIALEYAKIVFGDHPHIRIRGDATNIPLPDGSFSFVHSVGLIEHFTDNMINKMVVEMCRLVLKGGHVFIAVPNYFSPDMISLWRKYGKGSERYIPAKRLAEIAGKSGLSIVAFGHSGFSFSENLGHYVPQSVEKLLGKCGLGFLNYVVCKK
jgi:ubiquinone/menaquinone biosynthesis C-methylase UbiE